MNSTAPADPPIPKDNTIMNTTKTTEVRTQPSAPNAKIALGVPFLPPAALSAGSGRIRQRLGRMRRAMAPPPVQMLESALSLLEHRVLVALCTAGVPDALTEPINLTALAAKLGADEHRLERLVRYGSTRGWWKMDRLGRVSPNKVTEFLRTGHPSGWRAWVDFLSIPEVVDAVAALDLSETAPFSRTAGKPFFDWMADHQREWGIFDRAMAAGGRMHALTLDAAVSWKGTASVCDVGGGTGDLLSTLLDRHPEWRGAVFDLPDVVDRAVQHARMERIAGDAFISVPSGYDTYLLVNVLHDWGNADSTRILRNVTNAMAPAGRLLVVDSERRTVPQDEIFCSTDVLMAALTDGGQERSRAELRKLGHDVGLRLTRSSRLASGDVAHEFRQQRNP